MIIPELLIGTLLPNFFNVLKFVKYNMTRINTSQDNAESGIKIYEYFLIYSALGSYCDDSCRHMEICRAGRLHSFFRRYMAQIKPRGWPAIKNDPLSRGAPVKQHLSPNGPGLFRTIRNSPDNNRGYCWLLQACRPCPLYIRSLTHPNPDQHLAGLASQHHHRESSRLGPREQ